MIKNEAVLVLDFGGQYCQLIARRVRECSVYCEIKSYKTPVAELKKRGYKGIILTGGGSLLKNLDYKIKEETGLPVALADDPLTTVAMGTGKAMMDPELLKKLAIS